MINLLKQKIAKYFSDKTIAQVNADPVGIAKQHFSPAVEMLQTSGEVKSLFWVGSYEYNLGMIDYFKRQSQINGKTFDENPFRKSTEDERVVDMLLGKGSDDNWFLAFFEDTLDLKKRFSLLDSFKIDIVGEAELITKRFTKIV